MELIVNAAFEIQIKGCFYQGITWVPWGFSLTNGSKG